MEERMIRRFTTADRIGHIVLAVTCIVLMITGLLITFHELAVFAHAIGGYDVVSLIHQIAAVILIAACFYHVAYHALNVTVGGERKYLKDVSPLVLIREFIKFVLVVLTLEDTRIGKWIMKLFHIDSVLPNPGKYSWRELFDYWGAVIFMPILLVTGFFMMFPYWTMTLMPKEYLIGIRLLHRYDAMVVMVAFLLHFYNVHLNTKDFPMRWTIFTGKISEKDAKEEYPAWVPEGK